MKNYKIYEFGIREKTAHGIINENISTNILKNLASDKSESVCFFAKAQLDRLNY